MHLQIVLLPLLFLVECNAYAFVGEPHYIRTGDCKDINVCVYTYEAVLVHSVDIQRQNVTVSATFEVVCDSTGEYAYHKATKYCLSVTESFVEHEGSSGTEHTELAEKLSGWFCFVQTEKGKIPIVLHPQSENQSIINFKKAIVSGFQANFDGTDAVEEIDPESVHMSHYKYIVRPQSHHRSGHMYRHFNHNNVDRTATPFPVPVEYSKEEEIEYRNGVLYHAHGETHLVVPQRHHKRTHVQEEESMQESLLDRDPLYNVRPKRRAPKRGPGPTTRPYNPSININWFSVYSTYTLDLAYCSSAVENVGRKRRDVQASMTEEYVSTSLSAVIAHENHAEELHQLNVASILEYIYKHPDDTEQVMELKKYLVLEDKSDSASAISETVHFLNNIQYSPEPEDIAMRLKIYAMLAPLTNPGAQQALLSCVDDVTNATEWNSLLLNIALLAQPSTEFVAQLQSLITAKTVRDSSSLLLVYGALASRADPSLQTEMVAYLNTRVQESTDSSTDLVHLINALGNSGSSQIVDILLDYIDYDALDIQLAIITAMRKQTKNARVLSTFLNILKAPNPNARVVGAIANSLIKGVEAYGVGDVQVTIAIANALVSSSKTLNNDYISELVSYYLSQLRQHNVRVGRRLRRDVGNWMSFGQEYNMIASYETRQEDGIKYLSHSAYLWSQQIGVKNFNMQVASGMFTGAGDKGGEYKIFGKAVARVNAFGESVTAMEVEVLRTRSFYGDVHRMVYVTVGGYVLLNFEAFTDDEESPTSYGMNTEYQILERHWEVFVALATVNTRVVMYAQMGSYFGVNAKVGSEQGSYIAEGLLSPTVAVRMEGSSTFDVLGNQGETSLNGIIGYAFEAEGHISGCTNGQPAVTVCTTIEDQWPQAYTNLSTWYRAEKTASCGFQQCTWEGDKVPDSLPVQRWVLNAKHPELLWTDCMRSETDGTEVCSSSFETSRSEQPRAPVDWGPYENPFPTAANRPSWPTGSHIPQIWPDFPTRDQPDEY